MLDAITKSAKNVNTNPKQIIKFELAVESRYGLQVRSVFELRADHCMYSEYVRTSVDVSSEASVRVRRNTSPIIRTPTTQVVTITTMLLPH